MEILLIVFINVLFLVGVYFVLSRKVARIEDRGLPKELEDEMSSIITSFNSTADRNIDLLDDRLRKLEPLTARAEKLSEQLDGLVRRAEAMTKLRELMHSGGGQQHAGGTAAGVPSGSLAPARAENAETPPADAAGRAHSAAGNHSDMHRAAARSAHNSALPQRTEAARSRHDVAQVYKNTRDGTSANTGGAGKAAHLHPDGGALKTAKESGKEKKALPKKDGGKNAGRRDAGKKETPRRKKTPEEILRAMTEAGDDASAIARVLSISREEVLLKQKLLGLLAENKSQK